MLRFIAILALAASLLSAQTFESASIRPYVPQDDEDSANPPDPGAMLYRNVSLKLLLTAAYGVRADQIEGPDWLDVARFDIVAKPPAGATRDQVPAMLRNLLADRFHMEARTETRQRIGYALVAGKDGAKLKRTGAITGVNFSVAADHIDITGASVSVFAGMLSQYMGRPVADQTGIQGSYDFRLNVTMADLKAASPAIFTGIQGLGLALETRTTSASYVVVVKADRTPTGN
jgi:uncharacterized protein (TIGR03435 family)